ncbi:MAG: ABC transporter permease subunit [Bacteroidetes bacterium]|nr:ABC transporter permease subunit [Bacteroidota bacterium]MBU2584612.1 ABC transporter permease subunit [Bacteroidota bacterium]
MINIPIIKRTIFEIVLQPTFVFALVIKVLVVFFLIYGVALEYEQGTLISIKILGTDYSDLGLNTYLIRSFAEALMMVLMFVYILQSSSLFPETLKSPLLGITLTKSVSRSGLFISKFIGQAIVVFLPLLILGVTISLVLFFKNGGFILLAPVFTTICFFFVFITMFSLLALLSFFIEKYNTVSTIGIGIYFLLSPLLVYAVEYLNNPLIFYLSHILPPLRKLELVSINILLGKEINIEAYALSSIYIIIYFLIAIYLFRRRDIS